MTSGNSSNSPDAETEVMVDNIVFECLFEYVT